MNKLEELDFTSLIQLNETQRDEQWEINFLKLVLDEKLSLLSPEPQKGPDGWPYLLVKTGKESSEPFLKVLEWLSERGIGLAINTHKQLPDYVFTYGMLWAYREYGSFLVRQSSPVDGKAEYSKDKELMVGAPSEQYLPLYVRAILKQFFKDQKIENVKILVAHTEEQTDLCISLDSLGSPPEREHAGIAQAVSWFLPQNYSLVLTEEKNWKKFYEL